MSDFLVLFHRLEKDSFSLRITFDPAIQFLGSVDDGLHFLFNMGTSSPMDMAVARGDFHIAVRAMTQHPFHVLSDGVSASASIAKA